MSLYIFPDDAKDERGSVCVKNNFNFLVIVIGMILDLTQRVFSGGHLAFIQVLTLVRLV